LAKRNGHAQLRKAVNPRNFFAELKRRHVYKVAVAYAVVAWLLIQVATQVFPFFEIPNWAVRLVVLLLILGFPVALILAWAFELTPEGIKRAEDVDPNESITPRTGRKLVGITVALAVIAAGLLAFQLLRSKSAATALASKASAAVAAAVSEKSIAVLPFESLSEDKANTYFAEGIQDEILTKLAKIGALKVISRTSTHGYESKPGNLPDIAKQLGVANILEGSVQKSADQVRVNVQLINALSDSHLWAETYDRQLTDIFGVESEVAEKIADSLRATLTGSEQHAITARPTENAEAHDFYLRGRFFWNKRSVDGFKAALDYFEQAVRADPNYAVAYAGMADCYLLLPLYGSSNSLPAELFPKAMAMAKKAITIDPNLAEPHASLGLLDSFNFDFPASVREFEQAIQLNPNYATAHQWFGDSTLPSLGQFDRANAEMKRALELDPLSFVINDDVGFIYWLTGRYQEAVAQLRKTIEMDPNSYYPHRDLGEALEGTGDLAGAIAEYEKAVHLDDDPSPLALLGAAKAKTGQRPAAVAILQQLEEIAKRRFVPDYLFALVHLALGGKDEAMRWLESSYEKRQPDLNWIRIDPNLRPLHGDPRFEALAEKIVPKREFAFSAPPSNR
jgi:TolB-like protein/Tfp pilus assembly protein PilF